jgi:hypothetical protein
VSLAHHELVTVLSFCDEVRAVIDPIVLPLGFTCGQAGGSQVIFCAALDEFATRFPRLPQAGEQQRGTGACVDLVVTADDDRMEIASVRLEGTPLEEALRGVGLAEHADAVHNALSGDLTGALNVVASALRHLFVISG